MKKENIKVIIAIVIVGVLTLGITGTFAYFTYSDKQTTANTFKSGCLEISIENVTNALDLNNQKPITDVEGLKSEGYEFKIKNTCTTKERYEINLETLTGSTLNADYVRVSLSSDTFDNIITTLSENNTRTYHSSDASTSYKLYTGELQSEQTKTFKLREWVKYETTVEQGSNKIYKSKINVIANPDLELDNTFKEIKHENKERTITVSNISGTTYKYCTTSDEVCTPTTTPNISNNKVTYQIGNKEQIICSNIDNSKTICSEVIERVTAKETILADNENPKTLGTITGPACDNGTNAENHNTSGSNCSMTDKGLYSVSEGNETSYVYRGTVDNNWVKFGTTGTNGPSSGDPIWWRIIRINGDGSVRMIYAGTGSSAPQTGDGKWATTTTNNKDSVTQIEISSGNKITSFNSSYDDNAYIGYMYGDTGASTWANAHKNEHPSNVKKVLDEWYNQNLSELSTKLSHTAGFCGDRSSTINSTEPAKGGGYGTQFTHYGAYYRNVTNKTPSFKCTYKGNDLYTTPEDASQGNKKLSVPIGLITADEVAFAGGVIYQENQYFYLYTDKYYWTMSPSYFYNGNAGVFYVEAKGALNGNTYATSVLGVRPVINLKADTTFAGNGLYNDPYIPT